MSAAEIALPESRHWPQSRYHQKNAGARQRPAQAVPATRRCLAQQRLELKEMQKLLLRLQISRRRSEKDWRWDEREFQLRTAALVWPSSVLPEPNRAGNHG